MTAAIMAQQKPINLFMQDLVRKNIHSNDPKDDSDSTTIATFDFAKKEALHRNDSISNSISNSINNSDSSVLTSCTGTSGSYFLSDDTTITDATASSRSVVVISDNARVSARARPKQTAVLNPVRSSPHIRKKLTASNRWGADCISQMNKNLNHYTLSNNHSRDGLVVSSSHSSGSRNRWYPYELKLPSRGNSSSSNNKNGKSNDTNSTDPSIRRGVSDSCLTMPRRSWKQQLEPQLEIEEDSTEELVEQLLNAKTNANTKRIVSCNNLSAYIEPNHTTTTATPSSDIVQAKKALAKSFCSQKSSSEDLFKAASKAVQRDLHRVDSMELPNSRCNHKFPTQQQPRRKQQRKSKRPVAPGGPSSTALLLNRNRLLDIISSPDGQESLRRLTSAATAPGECVPKPAVKDKEEISNRLLDKTVSTSTLKLLQKRRQTSSKTNRITVYKSIDNSSHSIYSSVGEGESAFSSTRSKRRNNSMKKITRSSSSTVSILEKALGEMAPKVKRTTSKTKTSKTIATSNSKSTSPKVSKTSSLPSRSGKKLEKSHGVPSRSGRHTSSRRERNSIDEEYSRSIQSRNDSSSKKMLLETMIGDDKPLPRIKKVTLGAAVGTDTTCTNSNTPPRIPGMGSLGGSSHRGARSRSSSGKKGVSTKLTPLERVLGGMSPRSRTSSGSCTSGDASNRERRRRAASRSMEDAPPRPTPRKNSLQISDGTTD